MTQQGTCQHPPCELPAEKASWHNVHYTRMNKGMDMEAPIIHRNKGKTCTQSDCPRPGRNKGLCGMHARRLRNGTDMATPLRGQKSACKQDNFELQAVAKGYCQVHYYRLRNDLDMAAPIRHKIVSYDGATCKHDQCDRPARANGWCQLHWQRERKGIPINAPLRETVRNIGECQWSGCTREQSKKQLCNLHYTRQREGWDMDAPVKPLQKRRYGLTRNVLKDGYVEVKRPGHFGKNKARGDDWYAEHRYVMECYLRRPLHNHENVHHINGKRDDNRLENLELWTSTQPAGQRVIDLLDWADYIIAQYEPELDKLRGTQLPLDMPQDSGQILRRSAGRNHGPAPNRQRPGGSDVERAELQHHGNGTTNQPDPAGTGQRPAG